MLPGVKGIKNSQGSEWKPLEQIPGTIFPYTHFVSWSLVNNIYFVVCQMLLEVLRPQRGFEVLCLTVD